jgi:tRNA-modifying protein YgfZ
MQATFEQQYAALQHELAVAALPNWSGITITGADRTRFVNNFCTNDVNSLSAGNHREVFFTDVKGRILGHGVLYAYVDELIFIGPPNQSAALIQHLDRYVIREDVQLRDSTAEYCYFFISKPIARDNLPDIAVKLVPWPDLVPSGSGTLVVPRPDAEKTLDTLHELGYLAIGPDALLAARIEAGLPLFGTDFDSSNFPQEVNRDREAISFTKGCYLGQETVARIDALGHVNKHITGVRFNYAQLPAVGLELTCEERPAGKLTSVAISPKLAAPLAMAMIRREAAATGTHLQSSAGEGEVTNLPIT